jgi:hypothetical protein
MYSALPIDAQFASGASSVLTVDGPALGHDSALIDVGLNVHADHRTYFTTYARLKELGWCRYRPKSLHPIVHHNFVHDLFVGYKGQVGRGNYDSNGVICSVHLSF